MTSKMDTVLSYAESWENYVEKATPNYKYYDDKAANAGNNNWTRFGRAFDNAKLATDSKDGYAWCAMFVASCIVEKLGVAAFKTLLHNHAMIQYTAGVDAYKNIAKANGEWYEVKDKSSRPAPKRGDLIIFWANVKQPDGTIKVSLCAHIGFVTGVDANKIYTVEGNTSSNPGVVSNGGAVRQKSYALTYANIYGYCRLPWASIGDTAIETPVTPPAPTITRRQLSKGASGDDVKALQTALNNHGATPKLSVDGSFGSATDAAVRAFQKAHGLAVDGYVGAKTYAELDKPPATTTQPSTRPVLKRGASGAAVRDLQEILHKRGANPKLSVDGSFGPATYTAVQKFQLDNKLAVDGAVGPLTWAALFK
ncbi:hypothetical protein FACS18949_15210 [Clostridia bacterium]|nr:hypothetical protein FACS189425_10530 [Clostridia bacterium]GHV36155.1 hypothetical protein FACS18949_15210 [Clostridia bacterium]